MKSNPIILRPAMCDCELVFTVDEDAPTEELFEASRQLVRMNKVCKRHRKDHEDDHDKVHKAIIEEGRKANEHRP